MVLALPGPRGLFSQMQHTLTNQPIKNKVTLTKHIHTSINDFTELSSDIVAMPTQIAELIPLYPSVIGTYNASGKGAGGVIFAAKYISKRPFMCSLSTTPALPNISTTLPPAWISWTALTNAIRTACTADPALVPTSSHHPIVYCMASPSPRSEKF